MILFRIFTWHMEIKDEDGWQQENADPWIGEVSNGITCIGSNTSRLRTWVPWTAPIPIHPCLHFDLLQLSVNNKEKRQLQNYPHFLSLTAHLPSFFNCACLPLFSEVRFFFDETGGGAPTDYIFKIKSNQN
jgi:hypothetical protein